MALPDWMLPIKKELDKKIESHCEKALKLYMDRIENQGKLLLNMGYKITDLTIIATGDGSEPQWSVWPVDLVKHKPLPLEWSQSHPTVGGYYWRRTPEASDDVVLVRIRRRESPVSFIPQWFDTDDREWTDIVGTSYRWAGPIAPPPIK